MSSPDVAVIGGGIMGSSIALELARAGAKVRVLERSVPGAEASTVAAGILAPLVEHWEGGPAMRLGIASRELHETLAASLLADVGIDVGFRRTGALVLALDEGESRALRSRVSNVTAAGQLARQLSRAEVIDFEPRLSPHVLAAVEHPEEAQVEPPLLLRATAIAAERAGAVFQTGATVLGVRVEGDRARGVALEDGVLAADHVVVAAGSWTASLAGLPRFARSISPIRGQLVHTDSRPPIASRILFGGGAYVVPRRDGRVICGATMEDVGFHKEVTLGGVAEVIGRAARIVPDLARAPLLGTAVNFRPSSPDGLPLVGPTGVESLWLATGHYRNGILLAPITARSIADHVLGRKSSVPDRDAIDPRRFLERPP